MLIKILCECGTKFSFDVEPVHGRMPVPVSCPSCGVDATLQANQRISESSGNDGAQSAGAVPVAQILPAASAPNAPIAGSAGGPMRINRPPPAAPASPPPAAEAAKPGLAIRQQGVPSSQGSADSATETRLCAKHHDQPAVEACYVCGRPICRKCMRVFGYVCSVYCRDKAEASGQHIPVYAGQKSAVQKKARAKSKAVAALCVSIAVLLLATWMWYAFAGSKPRVVYSQRLPQSSGDGVVKLMEPGRHLIISSQKLALFDQKERKEIWSASIAESAPASGAEAGGGEDGEEDDEDYFYYSNRPRVLIEESDLWLLVGNRLLCHDLANGERKHESRIPGSVTDWFASDAGITIVSTEYGSGDLERRFATRVALPGGEVKTQDLVFPAATEPGAGGGARNITFAEGYSPPVQTASGPYPDDNLFSGAPIVIKDRVEIAAAGANVVQCEVKVLEEKVVVHEAIKKNNNPLLESGRMSAARSLEAAEELLNDLSRSDDGGKVYEDASKYRVTLRRVFAPQAEPWTGEVTGQVNFFPLNTVDLLVAGKSLHVFDKNNKKRWESALTYTISEAFAEHGDGQFAPAVEHDGTLYFFDQGVMTAFDLNSGEVRWRVTSVWISRVVPDGEGSLYVSTTTAAPEDIQYSKQVKIFERIEPILMKVDAGTGEVKWKVPRAGDECFVSGKYLYGARSTSSILSMFDPDGEMTVQFFLNRINPRNGKVIWTYEQPRMPEHMDFQGKNILLQFSGELQVLHYLAL